VHLPQWVLDELQALAVGTLEVERRAARLLRGDARGFQLGLEVLPALGLQRDREVVQTAEHLGVAIEFESREVEERDEVAVADVEEEMCGTLVVAVLEEVGERELEQILVEGDRALDVARQQGEVMHPTRRR